MEAIVQIFIGGVFACLAGASKGVKDKLQFHFFSSVFVDLNHTFWNPEISWRRKYKNGIDPTPRFFGSTTIFVAFTDGWHLFQMLETVFTLLAFTFALHGLPDLYEVLITAIAVVAAKNIMFQVTFKELLTR